MSRTYPFVWVHLGGSKIPPYLRISLENFSELFENQSLVLLVDEDKNLGNLQIKNLTVKKVELVDPDWDTIKSTLGHDLNFRNEFWFNSLARFKIIHMYMTLEDVGSLLHIESDVTFTSDFPFQILKDLRQVLAYPLQGDGQGIASLLHVGSREVLAEFLTFCSREVSENSKSTDMTILFNFLKHNPEKVVVMPTLPAESENGKKGSTLYANVSQNLDLFGGVFDAISIGQYLFGVDPRNHRGRKKLYWEDKSHWVKPSKYKFEWSGNSLLAKRANFVTKVFSLHIHSKDPVAFTRDSIRKELETRYKKSKTGEKNEIVFRELLKSISMSLRRRFEMKWK